VIGPEVDAGAVGSGAQHQVLHSFRYPYLLTPWHGGVIVLSVPQNPKSVMSKLIVSELIDKFKLSTHV
jgi:hypothetical protein